MRYVDMHCHLDLMADGAAFAQAATEDGIAILDATVEPVAFERVPSRPHTAVRRAVGLHPWWLADGRCTQDDVELLCRLASGSRYIGEVGLDFGKRYAETAHQQTEAFRHLAEALASHPVSGRVLTIHAVRSAATVMDILEAASLTKDAVCILHWFSGTSDELARARHMGLWFSVNEHMLATRKGREYVRIIPQDRLLLETDAPPGTNVDYPLAELEASLQRTLTQLAQIRGTDEEALGRDIAERSVALLEL